MADALQQVNELTGLVNNLLLLASLDAADKPEALEEVELSEVVNDLGEVFEVLAQEKGLGLRILDCEDCSVKGDRTLLRRLFANLIENAIRYTPSGSVKVNLRREEDACNVTISDTGVGIDTGDIAKIFDRFYRADRSRSRGAGGTGLGLSICQRIVELHAGRIQIESQKGKGTTVTVVLPALELHSGDKGASSGA